MKGKRVLALMAATALLVTGCGGSGTEDGTKKTEQGEPKKETVVTVSAGDVSPIAGGKFEGWGTSFCWWANRLGYSDTLASEAAAALYDAEKGLGFNIIRYNIGGGDDPTHDHITRTDSAVPGYLVYNKDTGEAVYDWNADSNQRNVLLKAQAVCDPNELIVEGFSNSAPYFMTVSGCTSGAEDAGKNNLKEECVDDFAQYLAEVTLHFKEEWGVTFQSLSPMNEPYTNYWGAFSPKQEGCHFDMGKTQSDMLVALDKALAEKNLSDVLVVGTDETSIDQQIQSYGQLSDEAKAVLDRIDTHTYGGSNRAGLLSLAQKEGKNLWMSEVDGGDTAGEAAGQMGAALWLAQRIIDDVNGFRPSAWVMWQAIDNHICEAGYNGKKDSGMVNRLGGYWGIAVANHDTEKIVLTQKYYAMGQFSRYIRPGYEIISTSDKGNVLAAYDPEGKKAVIVVINKTFNEQNLCFDLGEFSKVGGEAKPIRTSGSYGTDESWAELPAEKLDGSKLHVSLPRNSITTYIVEGVER